MNILRHQINILALIVITAIAFSTQSCKEVGPQIDLTNGKHNVLLDTVYVESPVQTPETKNVLIEDFTGIQCLNCPASHAVIDNLINTTGGRVVGIAMHTSFQDDPLPNSTQVLTSSDAQVLLNYMIDPGFKPCGAVNRRIRNTSFGNQILDVKDDWSGYTQADLTIPTPVNIELTRTYLDSSRTLTIAVDLHYTSAVPDSNKLSIFLTEDSIVSSQLLADNSNDVNYVHNKVFRAAVTPILGDKVNANISVPGTVVRRIYTFKISDAIWKPEHMNIVAFVHKYQNSADVLQVKSISLK